MEKTERVIKFRAWDKSGERWLGEDQFQILPSGYVDGWDEEGNIENKNIVLVQFTGLHDKNGKEIYEGDICNMRRFSHIDNSKKWKVYEICWGYSEWLFRGYYNKKLNDECFSIRFPEATEIEVIGNIYENPELLKEV